MKWGSKMKCFFVGLFGFSFGKKIKSLSWALNFECLWFIIWLLSNQRWLAIVKMKSSTKLNWKFIGYMETTYSIASMSIHIHSLVFCIRISKTNGKFMGLITSLYLQLVHLCETMNQFNMTVRWTTYGRRTKSIHSNWRPIKQNCQLCLLS